LDKQLFPEIFVSQIVAALSMHFVIQATAVLKSFVQVDSGHVALIIFKSSALIAYVDAVKAKRINKDFIEE
jgi:hypothetical protein